MGIAQTATSVERNGNTQEAKQAIRRRTRFLSPRDSGFLDDLAVVAAIFAAGYVLARKGSADQGPRNGGVDNLHSAATYAEGGGDVARQRRAEPGRGRLARGPNEIPMRGWKDILWRVWYAIDNDRLLAVAAGVTFYALLALFPAIAAVVSIYGLYADVHTMRDHLDSLAGVLPAGGIDIIGGQMNRLAEAPNTALGFAFFFSLSLALWSANSGIKALFDALNVVYKEREKRNFFRLNLASLTFTLGAILFLLCAIAGIVVVPVILKYLWLDTMSEQLMTMLRWPALLFMLIVGLAILYRYGPSRELPRLPWVTWGSAVAAVLWLLVSMAFSLYVKHFGSYDETYGSLGAVIGFMTWIWISTIVILLGGELNAEMEHQTARDTTTGPVRPLGDRGAAMADTVGAGRA